MKPVTDQAMTPELLPCPFCGGEARLLHCCPGTYMVQCTSCKATSDDRGQDGTIKAWNARIRDELRDALEAIEDGEGHAHEIARQTLDEVFGADRITLASARQAREVK